MAGHIYLSAFDESAYSDSDPSRRDATPRRLFAWKPGLKWSRDMEQCADHGVTMMLDSGAFGLSRERRRLGAESTAWQQRNRVLLEGHTEYIARYGEQFALVAALDVIGDPAMTLANYEWQRDRVPMAFPTWHFTSTLDDLDAVLALNPERIGIGGMARSHKAAMPAVHAAFDKLCDANGVPRVMTHGFGAASGAMLKSLPWSSVDAATATVAAKGKRLLFFDGAGNTPQLILRETDDGELEVLDGKRALRPFELDAVKERLRHHGHSLEGVAELRECRLDYNARELVRAEAVIPERYVRPRSTRFG